MPRGSLYPEYSGTEDQRYSVGQDGVFGYSERTSLGTWIRLKVKDGWLTSTAGSFEIIPGPLDCDPLAGHVCSGQTYFSASDYFIRSVLPGGTLRATVVPEASTPIMLVFGLGVLALILHRSKRGPDH